MFLSLSASKKELDFFYSLAKKRHNAIKKSKYVLIKHEDYSVVLYPFIKFSKLLPDDILDILNKTKSEKAKKIVIPCDEASKESLSFSKNFDIQIIILDKYETYKKLYKDYDYFPKITRQYKKDKKATIKELLSFSFNRSKVKNYIFSAIVLMFSSLFVKVNIYYCTFASILVIFAIISFFSPFNKASQKFEL